MYRKICVLLILWFTSNAFAQTSYSMAHEAYQQALTDLQAGRKSLLNGRVIAFSETFENKDGELTSIDRTLRLNKSGEEIVLPSTDEAVNDTQLNWQHSVLVDPNMFPKKAVLLRETGSTWVFQIPTVVSAEIEEVDQGVDVDSANLNFQSALSSELTVSKRSPTFLSLTVVAKQPFKPEAMVKVSEFKVRMEFAKAWQSGPLVAVNISRVLKAKYAFFIGVDELSITRYQQFRLAD